MSNTSPAFTIEIEGISGSCPSGERWAQEQIDKKAIPVLSCEGPCIRGDIARLTANIISKHPPYARACYAETALVPHSGMAKWVKSSEQIIIIDGCFLKCIGRLIGNLVNKENIIQIDAHRFHKKYSKIFHMDDVPESERKETSQSTAEAILALLQNDCIKENAKLNTSSCSE